MNHICIFEDEKYLSFFPLTVNRPVCDLLIGIGTMYEKVRRFFPYSTITLHVRSQLKPLLKQTHPGIPVNNINMSASCLFLNGRVHMTDSFFNILKKLDLQYNWLLTSKGQVIAAYLTDENLNWISNLLTKVPTSEEIITELRPKCMCQELEHIPLIEQIWDLIHMNSDVLTKDFKSLDQFGILKGDVHPFSCIYNENNVYVDKGSVVEAYAVLNAEKGPIYIDKNVYIEAHTRLEGPLYIGEGTRIMGGKISSSSIGPFCKIRGEVSNSIFLGYSNKAHDGFIGHSYLGEWVNLGALTTNSNLKNTYGEVILDFDTHKERTGQQFLGTFFGDYVKTAIGTLLNTGTVIGFGANLLGSTVHEKYIPSFSWGEKGSYIKYQLDKFIEVASSQMLRRAKEISVIDKEYITQLYTSKEHFF